LLKRKGKKREPKQFSSNKNLEKTRFYAHHLTELNTPSMTDFFYFSLGKLVFMHIKTRCYDMKASNIPSTTDLF